MPVNPMGSIDFPWPEIRLYLDKDIASEECAPFGIWTICGFCVEKPRPVEVGKIQITAKKNRSDATGKIKDYSSDAMTIHEKRTHLESDQSRFIGHRRAPVFS